MNAKLNVTIDSSNAAFADDPIGELKRALQDAQTLTERLNPGVGTSTVSCSLRDTNGNYAGTFMAQIEADQ